jgi:Pre-rRNA-processing protein TSR2
VYQGQYLRFFTIHMDQNQLHDFTEGVKHLINKWPALKLIINNDSEGILRAQTKSNNLIESIVEYWVEEGGKLELDDMIDFFDAYFEDVFEVGVDDGSIEENSSLICNLWSDILSGKRPVIPQENISTVQDMQIEEIHPVQPQQQPEPVKPKDDIIIDEDGSEWHVVSKGNRRRNR